MPNDFGPNVMFDPTQTVAIRTANSAFTHFVGRAPMANAYGSRTKAGQAVLCNTMEDFQNKFGWSEDFLAFELCGAANLFFNVFKVKPVSFASVLDIDEHAADNAVSTNITLSQRFGRSKATVLPDFGALPETITLKLTDTSGEPIGDALVLEEDYTLGINSEGYSFIRPVLGGAVFPANPVEEEVAVHIRYECIDPAAVTVNQVRDVVTSSVSQIYPKLHKVPQLLVAPGWSRSASISDALVAASTNINGIFNANSIVDIDSTATGARDYQAAAEFKDKNGQNAATQKPCWPCRRLDEAHIVHYSSVIAGLINSMEANIGAPAQTESNQSLPGTGFCLEDGTDIVLSFDEANWLRGYGITCGLFWDGVDRAWGAYSGMATATTDPAEKFWTTNRFLRWYGNNLSMTWFSKVDQNITRRLIDMIVATENDRLRMFAANNWCPIGEIYFDEALNPDSQLANGHIVFSCRPSAYLPAQRIDFRIELDLQSFFDELRGGAAA